MVNSSRRSGLGQTLIRTQKVNAKKRSVKKSARHCVEEPVEPNTSINLKSVTDQTNLTDFFEEAELAGRSFVTERNRNLTLMPELDEGDNKANLQCKNKITIQKMNYDFSKCLRIPRRPEWNEETTPEQLNDFEKKSFLAWRKAIAVLQEGNNILMTPFEKNIEVWRQLWRVIERSDIVVQILDCRNPLLYICDDLIEYVEDSGYKLNLLLLNKADYLTKQQRQLWAKYFKERGIRTMFFSALIENGTSLKQNNSSLQADFKENSEDEVSSMMKNSLSLDGKSRQEEKDYDDCKIYDKFELLDEWKKILDTFEREQKSPVEDSDDNASAISKKYRPPTVGLVGYPNVGKSSTINALISAKRVAVSATPGKTKHFQTFFVDKDMMLCDCPGLVFPNFISSRSEMVVNGILPIDQMKDCISPVRMIVDRIPKGYFEEIYGLAFEQDEKQNLIAEDLLNAFGFMRGYMTARGLPDISRAARKICKDYLDGKILHCEPPPDVDNKLYHSHSRLAEIMKRIEERSKDPSLALKITERQRRLMAQAKGTNVSANEFDAKYFLPTGTRAHIKGLPGIGNLTSPVGQNIEVKLPKREKRHKKREKLRRIYRDLDI